MNTYRVVFRNSTVVDTVLYDTKTIAKAAKKAIKDTRPGKSFDGWTVYSVTLY